MQAVDWSGSKCRGKEIDTALLISSLTPDDDRGGVPLGRKPWEAELDVAGRRGVISQKNG